MRITLSLDPAELAVSSEAVAACDLRVGNPTPDPCNLRFEVVGEAASWAWVTPATLVLPPGGEGGVRVAFRAPRSNLAPAGPLPFSVKASVAATTPGQLEPPAVATGTLHIAPFTDVFASLEPRISRGSRSATHTLSLENRGNAPFHAELTAPTEDVAVDVTPSTVTVEPGATATATVTVRPTGRAARGPGHDHPFHITAQPPGGPPVTVSATMRHVATPSLLPRAVLVAAVAVGIAMLLRTTLLAPAGPKADRGTASAPPCPAKDHLGSEVHGGREPLPAFGYTFLFANESGCLPVRFNPCAPVHYVRNDVLAPPGAVADLTEAMARLASATGITFVDDGPTDEPARFDRSPYQPERYGTRWAPILIAWSALGTGQGPDAAGNDILVAGQGRPLRADDVLVSGVLELNANAIIDRAAQTPLAGGFGEGITRGRVMLHELGHIVGLGHAGNPAQLLYPELAKQTSPTAEFGIGDITGLRLLGAGGGCLTPPPLPPASA